MNGYLVAKKQGRIEWHLAKDPHEIIWWNISREPPGILQEVGIPLNKIISGCNSDKKLTFFKKSCNPRQKV
jgi:hypothetical protein